MAHRSLAAGDQRRRSRHAPDRFSSAYRVTTAARAISAVAALRERAAVSQQRLATLTIETEIAFGSPRELRAFARDLQACIAELTQRYHRAGGRSYQVVAPSHPGATRPPAKHQSE